MGNETSQMPEEGMGESSPIDAMIEQLDSYIKNPSMVTPETLMQLKDGLMALKADVEGEETAEPMEQIPEEGSFSGEIQKKRMSGGAY
jgi:hypothetical protein